MKRLSKTVFYNSYNKNRSVITLDGVGHQHGVYIDQTLLQTDVEMESISVGECL